MNFIKYITLTAITTLFMLGCSSSGNNSKSVADERDSAIVEVSKVEFNGDSAYSYVAAQCEFGPRVPGTEAHRKCGYFLIGELSKRGNVIVQDAKLTTFDGVKLNARNIICEINPDSARRILLLAHWDSRPWADSDPDASKHSQPVMGANDGASGVGVLLEIARICSVCRPTVGVDILLVDVEDWGDNNSNNERNWALGTQYWAAHKHRKGYNPMFGILLDMVGTRDALFYQEGFSKMYAPQVVKLVWEEALKAGYSDRFLTNTGNYSDGYQYSTAEQTIVDDHYFVNVDAGIPCIDIIDLNGGNGYLGFFPQWHTTGDTMENISAETLKAVGQTVTNVIYRF